MTWACCRVATFLPICQDRLDARAPARRVPLDAQGAASQPKIEIAELLLKNIGIDAAEPEK
ncbi:hypothetical protein [Nocardia anaemiae]|uniref:hypothetical protein n=1 Tax=Nocardia anaemiae TaxID=263910 RepID=UPI0007A53FE7|nr:hypothetical protein [Nocardia anaemiae]